MRFETDPDKRPTPHSGLPDLKDLSSAISKNLENAFPGQVKPQEDSPYRIDGDYTLSQIKVKIAKVEKEVSKEMGREVSLEIREVPSTTFEISPTSS